MTPKEKAEELIGKFTKLEKWYTGSNPVLTTN